MYLCQLSAAIVSTIAALSWHAMKPKILMIQPAFFRVFLILFCTGGLACGSMRPLQAQPLPLDDLPRIPDEPLNLPELLPEQQRIELPEPPTESEFVTPGRASYVTSYTFRGNTIFSETELTLIAQPYTNRKVTFEELRDLCSQITKLYIERGYTTSRAFIPIESNQNFEPSGATIVIQVLEGRVEDLQMIGDARLERYVRARLESAIAPVFNQRKFEEAVRLLQADPLIQSISGVFAEGSESHLLTLTVQATGQLPFAFRTVVDNSRSPSIGTFQIETQIEAANILEFGERLSASYRYTEGSDQYDLNFSVPVNSSDGRISGRYTRFDGQIVEEPFNQFDIEASSRVAEVSYLQPIVRRAGRSQLETLAIGLTAARLESESTIDGFPFPLSRGADDQGKTRISELSFRQDYEGQTNRSILRARSDFSVGLDVLSATVEDVEPDGKYFLWRSQAAWLQRVFDEAQIVIVADVQIASEPLLPMVQFGLGGVDSVRGFRQSGVISDSGVRGTAELRYPLLTQGNTRLNIIPFISAGVGWNNGSDRVLENNILVAPGLGLQLQSGGLDARVNYSVPITDRGFDGGSLQESGIDFRFEYQSRF